jgi:hypothetical protein
VKTAIDISNTEHIPGLGFKVDINPLDLFGVLG